MEIKCTIGNSNLHKENDMFVAIFDEQELSYAEVYRLMCDIGDRTRHLRRSPICNLHAMANVIMWSGHNECTEMTNMLIESIMEECKKRGLTIIKSSYDFMETFKKANELQRLTKEK